MQRIKQIIILLAIMFTFASIFNVSANGIADVTTNTDVTGEYKIYSNATIEDNFTDDCVMVVMTNSASLAKLDYMASDFPEVNCKNLTNLSEATTNKVEVKLSRENDADLCSDSSNTGLRSDFYDVNLETFNQILVLELEETGKDKVLEAIEILEKRPDILYVGPNYIYSVESDLETVNVEVPNYISADLSRSVNTNDTYFANQWAINMINLPTAWQITTGSSQTIAVGIVDTGVDPSHPDLSGKINTNISTYIDRFGNVDSDETVEDLDGHGTMVAGIVGAITNNATGISGVNWNVSLVSININDPQKPTTRTIAEVINYAESKNILILNISIDTEINLLTEGYCEEECDICAYHCIENYPGLVVCSAGNSYQDLDEIDYRCPSSYDLNNIIVVGASTASDGILYIGTNSGSNYGNERVDLFAPGSNIYSTMSTDLCSNISCSSLRGAHLSGGYHTGSGTSFAAPYVTGVASLIMSKYPDLSIAEVKARILDSVDVQSPYVGMCSANGRLNAYKALHDHSFTNMYSIVDVIGHNSFCACGVYTFEDHSFTDIGGLLVCSDCEFAW